MQGSSNVQTVQTSEGAVRIENLGILGGQYLSPNTPSQIAILKGYPTVYDWTQIQNYVNGATAGTGTGNSASTYASYWYGNSRNPNNQAVNPSVPIAGGLTTTYQPSKYGGWSGSDSGALVSPVQPVISSSDKSNLPVDKWGYYSLTEFLEQAKGVQNLATTLFNTQVTGNTGALWQKASFVTDTNGQTALRLDIPWSAFGTPLVTIRVPSELADTWIDRPTIANAKLSAVWQSTGTDHSDVYGANRIAVTVTNAGSVTASTNLAIKTDNSKLSVTPLSMTVPSLAAGASTTVYFDATNLGVTSETDNIPVTITASDTYTNTQTASVTIYGNLIATLTTGTTTLKLHVLDKTTGSPIVGMPLTITYSTTSTPYTDSNGVIAMTLATPQGGAYTGTVTVRSQPYTAIDGTAYKSAIATYNIQPPGAYEYTYYVERVGTKDQTTDWLTIILIAIVIVLLIAVVAVIVYYMSRKRRRKKRN